MITLQFLLNASVEDSLFLAPISSTLFISAFRREQTGGVNSGYCGNYSSEAGAEDQGSRVEKEEQRWLQTLVTNPEDGWERGLKGVYQRGSIPPGRADTPSTSH